jgi:hypothetical protein
MQPIAGSLHQEADMRKLLMAAAFVLCACSSSMQNGGSGADVAFTATPASAMPGDSITLMLANRTDGQIGYNLCASSLERQAASGWDVMPSDIVCTMELRTLDPAQESTWRTALPADLSEGRYRYRTNVTNMPAGASHSVTSSEIRVGS